MFSADNSAAGSRKGSNRSSQASSRNIYELSFEERKHFTSMNKEVRKMEILNDSSLQIPESDEHSSSNIKKNIMSSRNSKVLNEGLYQDIKNRILVPVFEDKHKLKVSQKTSPKAQIMNAQDYRTFKEKNSVLSNNFRTILNRDEIMQLIRKRKNECFDEFLNS
mmetsp:Transcript_39034/g.44643  ORF Transcript_39034/g.44643 Transcript_39034/m.44643 type:complete len:164 (-) Transcript_39034:56-547(-)